MVSIINNNVFKFKKSKKQPQITINRIGLLVGAAAAILMYLGIFSDDTSSMSKTLSQAAFTVCSGPFRHNCVVDGDTIMFEGEKLRLQGIDTPEIFSPKCDYEYDLGLRARDELLAILNSNRFSVTRGSQDGYGRTLAVINLESRTAGSVLVEKGLARKWTGRREPWC